MKYTATAGLALSAFVLAGCNDDTLSTEETQAQLDAAFEQIDNLPEFDTSRFTEFVDEDGECVMAYEDRSKGVMIELSERFYTPSYIESFFPFDCADGPALTEVFDTTVDIYNFRGDGREYVDVARERADFKRELTGKVRDSYRVQGISTLGL